MKKISKAFSLSLMGAIAVPVTLSATTINQATRERESTAQSDSSLLVNQKNQQTKTFDLKSDSQYFFDFIKWVNLQSNQIVMLNWSASLPYEQEMFIAMLNFLNKSPNLLTIFQEEKSRKNPRYDLDKLVSENIINVLNPNADQPDQITNELDQSKINVLFDQWDSKYNSQINTEHFGPTLDYLNQRTPNQKINIVMTDMFFTDIFRDFRADINDPLIQILRHANSLLLVSDGQGHIGKAVQEVLYPFVTSAEFKKQDRKTVENNLKIVQTGSDDQITNLTKNDIYNFLLLDHALGDQKQFDFIHFLHYDASYRNNLFTSQIDKNGNHTQLIDEQSKWKVSSVSLNAWEYTKLLTDQNQTNIDKFIKLLDQAFFVDINKEEDLFVNLNQDQNDPWAFDPKKKNAIFIGSSLFSPIKELGHKVSSLEQFVNLREYVQASFDQFFKQYPLDEYNILFKHHPIYNPENAIELTKIYTNNKIKNPNILKPNIPFEYLLSSEFTKAKANKTNLFFTNVNGKIEPKFKLFGLQSTTSVIHTTRVFLESSLDLSLEQISQLISFEDFPVATLFDVIDKPKFDQKKFDKYESNKAKIENTYKFFNTTQWTKDPNMLKQEDRFLYSKIQPLVGKANPINDPMIDFLNVMFLFLILANIMGLSFFTVFTIKKIRNKNQVIFLDFKRD